VHEPLRLGILGFIAQSPAFIISPVAGVLADRLDRRRILMAAQTLLMLQAAALGMLGLLDRLSFQAILPLYLISGLATAVEIPTRQSFLIEMVDRQEDLANAIPLNSFLMNLTKLIGPAMGGLLLAGLAGITNSETRSAGWCFIINAVSFLAVLWALAAMRTKPRQAHPARHPPIWHGLKEGIVYAYGFTPIRWILTLLMMVSLMGTPYNVLMPQYVSVVLRGNVKDFGYLQGAPAVGAIIGAIFLASRSSVRGLDKVVPGAACIFGLGLILFSLTSQLYLAALALVIVGVGMMLCIAGCNTILQTLVDDDKRGRVMSLFALSFISMTPIGGLIMGFLADRTSVPTALKVGGMACIVAGILFVQKLPQIRLAARPVLIRKGILPASEEPMLK
jgi:MFS family permease